MKKLHQKNIPELSDGIDVMSPGYSMDSKRTLKIKRFQNWAKSILKRMVEQRKISFKMPDGTQRTINIWCHPKDCPETEFLYYFLLDKADIAEDEINGDPDKG